MARTLAALLAAIFLLGPASVAGQDAQPRMQRGQVPQQQAQTLTIEGTWGFPCARDFRCGSPEDQWVPLEVVAWVGDAKFVGEATTDFNVYTFEVIVQVAPARRSDLVMLEVLAQSPAGHAARFWSLQDTAAAMLAEAGSDGRIGSLPHRPTKVSVLTTALVGLMQEANGGDWRMSGARLAELVRQVDPERLVRHAQVFEGIIEGWLPGAGELDPNALIASSDAVEAYLAEVPDPLLVLSHEALQTPPLDTWDRTLVLGASPGTVPFGRREGVRLRMEDAWSPEWSGSIMDTGRAEQVGGFLGSNTDSFPFSARVVRPGHPSRETQRIRFECPGVGEVEALRVTERRPAGYATLAVAGGVEFASYGENRTHHYRLTSGVDPACRDAVPAPVARPLYFLALPARGFARAHVGLRGHGGSVALQLPNPNPDYEDEATQFIAGTLDLATGALAAPGYAADAVLAVAPEGWLTMTVETLPGSVLEGRVDTRMERVRNDGRGAEEWMLSTRLSGSVDDHLRAYATPVVRVDPRLVLGPQLLDGSWLSGVDLSRPDAVEAFTVEFNAVSGQGLEQAPGGDPIPFSWRLEDGNVVAMTFALNAEPDVLRADCPPGALDCREVRRRVWEPLRMGTRGNDRRLYVIESLWLDAGAGLARVSRQLNFYDVH